MFALAVTAAVVCLLPACSGQIDGLPEPRPAPESDVAAGRRLIAAYGCGACHSIPGVPGADAVAAPPLDRFYERSYIAGQLANTADNLIQWIQHPQAIEPGTAMPDLGVSEAEARAMAAYLYHQPSAATWLSR
jgi:cytochrome c1